jgi:ribonuclease Z
VKKLALQHRASNAKKASVQAHTRSQLAPTLKRGPRIRFYDSNSTAKPINESQSPSHAPLYSEFLRDFSWVPLLEPLGRYNEAEEKVRAAFEQFRGLDERARMSSSIEIITTPTADTPGTTLVLRTAAKHYVFGSQAEGTQRALVQQGTRLLKAQDFFLTGKAEWKNTGGFVGLMLTLADASSSSYEQAMELIRKSRERGRKVDDPPRPRFNIYGPPNLKHTLGTCRRFIFRRGIPINATEYADKPVEKDEDGNIPPNWQDANIQVWALPVLPVRHQQDSQAEADLEARRQAFDAQLNSFEDHQAPGDETIEDREARYDRIRSATLKFMFDSNWSFDTLVERHISEVQMPAALFIRDPDSHGYKPYTGPKPGGSEPLPDITVFTRTPWPGANILALPPTKPAPECVSYIVRTHPSRGVFDVARAKVLGVKPGPNFGKLTAGQSVQNEAGDWITPDQVLGADRPGQGIAILDVPSLEYLEAIVRREELSSSQVMNGIGAIVWMLGPSLSGHPLLTDFMEKLSQVEHVISSTDVSPNRIAHDSVAGQATRLGQVDPSRYSVPVYDNSTIPQNNLLASLRNQTSQLPEKAIAADRGMSFVLMPKFATKKETKSRLFDCDSVRRETDAEVLRLAESAQQAVKDDQQTMQAWKNMLARPDTEVTTLGTGSAMPSKYRNVSATLVRVSGVGNYLLDCGENTLGQLSRVFPPEELRDIIKNLRMIWISHLHADHHLGTAGVIRTWYHLVHAGVPNSEALDAATITSTAGEYGLSVISHSGMLQWLYEYSSVEDFGYSRILPLEISPNEVGRGSTLNIVNSFNAKGSDNTFIDRRHYEQHFGFSDIQSARVAHCHGAMAVSITFPSSPTDPDGIKPLKVSYSGDCRPSQHFAKIGRDTTVLVHEATFDDELQGDAKAKKHSTTSEALGIGAQMDAKAVVLTHFSQRYQKIPVLQTVKDGEPDDPLLNVETTAEEANNDDYGEVDPTIDNADNMDIHPTADPAPSSTAPKIPTLQHQVSSVLQENARVVKIRNPNMKVAIAFDYMRVKIGDIIELEKFNEALNELLVKEKDDETTAVEGVADGDGGTVNKNGKKTSGDEAGGKNKKQKQKQDMPKKQKSKRNN